MELEDNELHIWKYVVNETENYPEKTTMTLSKMECEKYESFICRGDAVRFMSNRVFLRKVLSFYVNSEPADLKFEVNNFGKPKLTDSNICFNTSHRNNFLLVAVGRNKEIGIDIEQIINIADIQAFISSYFTSTEINVILKSPKKEQLKSIFALWTLKEAFIKAIGKGLSLDLRQIEMTDYFNSIVKPVNYENKSTPWTIRNIDVDKDYIAAFAVNQNISNLIRMFHVQD